MNGNNYAHQSAHNAFGNGRIELFDCCWTHWAHDDDTHIGRLAVRSVIHRWRHSKRKYKIRLTVFAPTVHNFTPSRAHAQANSLSLSQQKKNDRNKWIVLVLVCPHSRFCLFLDVKWITKYFNQNQCVRVCACILFIHGPVMPTAAATALTFCWKCRLNCHQLP